MHACHVDWPCDDSCSDHGFGIRASRFSGGYGAARSLVYVSRGGMGDGLAARPASAQADREPEGISERTLPTDLEVLRDVRGTGRSLAAAGQFPGKARAFDLASDVADQHRVGDARKSGCLRI